MIRSLLCTVALWVVLLAPATEAVAQDAGSGVSVQDEVFSPPMTHVNPGGSLSWSNDGVEQHTITADDGSFDSGPLDPGQTFQVTFANPGSYPYYCSIHGGPNAVGMAGIVVVS